MVPFRHLSSATRCTIFTTKIIPRAGRAWWHRQQYDPGIAGLLVNPFYFARRGLRLGLQELFAHLSGGILDVGCGGKPYRPYILASRYVGLEIDTPVSRARGVADAYYDGGRFPFADEEFDGVLCSQVFEHVFTPNEFLAEIRRVLRPGGRLVLTVPFVWDEHEQPYDFGRYSSFGLRAALERAGFEVETMHKSVRDCRVLFQLLNAYLYKITLTRNQVFNVLTTVLLMAPVNLMGLIFGPLLPANPDLYLDNIILARKPGSGSR